MTAAPIKADRLRTLLRDMVNIYSPSGKEEEIVDLLAETLRCAGLPVRLREVTEGRFNIEVRWPGSQPEIAFMGHVDTVPAFDIERYEFDERDGLIRGLGTADMKSGCAAMIEAFIAAVESGLEPQRAALYLVVGEEESGDGTSALLDDWSCPWALIAEPTGLIPCMGHFSYVEILIRAFGTRRHAAQAGQEYNAIFSLLRTLLKVTQWSEETHPASVLNIRDLHSSESGFAVPDRCAALVDLHLPPQVDLEQLTEALRQRVKESLSGSAATRYEIDFPTVAPGYTLSTAGLLPEVLFQAYKQLEMSWEPGSFRSHSDANLLWGIGCRPVILGPGQLSKAHTRDESVDFEEVHRAAVLYAEILRILHAN